MNFLPPEFRVFVDKDVCTRCRRCTKECSFDAMHWDDEKGVMPDHKNCTACQRCVAFCPVSCITITENPQVFKKHSYWTPDTIKGIKKQAETSGMLLTSCGTDKDYVSYFDHLVLDACQVTNPSIDPLREPMELRTYLGSKPDSVELEKGPNGEVKLKTKLALQIQLDTPIMFAAMSFGAISLNAHKALAKTAKECGIIYNTGEGGLHKDLYEYGPWTMVQVASGRFGVNNEYLNQGAAIEIKVGQGAKPGIGGHLPGEKVNEEVSVTRMIPMGSDALSPAPHHDIYSIEDLGQLIFALKEATNYTKPVSVKISAVHNVAAIASGIARAGADIIAIDGFRGGTGAAPTVFRDHIGIPIEMALAAVDDRLRQEGIRNRVSIVASGGIRHSGDIAKAIALGADAVSIGSSALMAVGCTMCQKCYTGKCAWGIATQKPELTRRLNPEKGAQCLTNLINAWSLELKEILGALGVNSIDSLRGSRERLRGVGLDEQSLQILGVKSAGR